MSRLLSCIVGAFFIVSSLATCNCGQDPDLAARSQSSVTAERVIVVVGAAGESEFEKEFLNWSEGWKKLAERQEWSLEILGSASEPNTADAASNEQPISAKDQLRNALVQSGDQESRLWLVLIGHGTFANGKAKFNLVGPDIDDKELATWLKKVSSPIVIVGCFSSSAPFLTSLSAPDRIVLTAARSGSEINYSRFGKYLALAINALESDIDHDHEVSLLEAFLLANAQTARFYRDESRLATEHALLDDNGDKLGASGDFYRGIRPAKEVAGGMPLDGAVSSRVILYSSPGLAEFTPELTRRRQELELQIDQLRNAKAAIESSIYYDRLESLVLELAEVYDQAEAAELRE